MFDCYLIPNSLSLSSLFLFCILMYYFSPSTIIIGLKNQTHTCVTNTTLILPPSNTTRIQSPSLDVDENGTLDLSMSKRLCSGGGDSVLTPLEPMSPQRQAALLGSRCYGMGDAADCWDLPVDYTKIKHIDEDEKEVTEGISF